MADISEAFLLCRTFQKDSLLGIEKHLTKNHVILTFKDRGALIYNLENKKLINSLPVQQRREFSSSVVQDPCNRRYIGVLDDTTICQWSEIDGNLVECNQTKVDQPVSQILCTSQDICEPIVVFKDGICKNLSDCTLSTKKMKRKSVAISLRIISSSFLENANTQFLAIAKVNKDSKLCIAVYKISKGVQFLGEWTVDSPDKNAELVDCCFQTSNTNLISYWSNGSLCMTELRDVLTSNDQSSILPCKCVHKINVDSKSKTPVTIATVDSTHVCMSHVAKTENGTQETISIYETKFGTKQASISVDKLTSDEPASSLIGSSSGSRHMLCMDGYICTSTKYGIACCSYSVKELSLATALGKLAPSYSLSEATTVKPLLCIPHLPDPNMDWKNWVDSTNTSQTTEDEILSKLINPDKTKTVKTFTKYLNDYLESKCLRKEKDKKDQGGDVQKIPLKAKDKTRSKYRLTQHFVLAVLSRCLDETKFFAKEALGDLIKTRCIPGSSSPDLLKHLIEKNEVDLMLLCLKNIQGIPESTLVACIQYAVLAEKSVFKDDDDDQEDSQEDTVKERTEKFDEETTQICPCPFGKERSKLLCHLLSYPVNDVFVQQSIKKLPAANVIALMKFLGHVVQTAPLSAFARDDSPLSYAVALDWTGWLINAHYTSLVLMPDIHDLLQYMSDCVSNQVGLFENISRLEGFLHHYKYKQPLPSTERKRLYTIEMLEL